MHYDVILQGPVMFDENGDRKGLTQIEQLQASSEVRVAVYDPSSQVYNKMIWEQQHSIFWKGMLFECDSVCYNCMSMTLYNDYLLHGIVHCCE